MVFFHRSYKPLVQTTSPIAPPRDSAPKVRRLCNRKGLSQEYVGGARIGGGGAGYHGNTQQKLSSARIAPRLFSVSALLRGRAGDRRGYGRRKEEDGVRDKYP